jgi:hypothetical protein
MLTRDGQTINRETAAHKYGGDPLAEYVHELSLDGSYADGESGDVEAPTGWFARFGKRLLHHDEQGFVEVVRYASADDATTAFEMLQDEYDVWADEDIDDHERADRLDALRNGNRAAWRSLQQRRQARYPKG